VANGTEIPTTVVLPPQTSLQLGAQSLGHVTSALGAQPIMLVVVLLNVVFASIGGYFLLQLEKYRATNLTALIDLMRSCVLETAPLSRDASGSVEDLRRQLDEMREQERERARPAPPS
jgi:hypothetical protein